jgi:type IV pilus assembly protein PilP
MIGCTKVEEPEIKPIVRPQPKAAAKKAKAKKEEAPAEELPPSYKYNPSGKVDPFKPVVGEKPASVGIEAEEPIPPAINFPLNEFRVVAIIHGLGDPRAMVENPKGDGIILTRGSSLGDKHGRVLEIYSNEVVVEEKVRDKLGNEKVVEVSLMLQVPEEGE